MSDDWLMAMRGELVKGYFGEVSMEENWIELGRGE